MLFKDLMPWQRFIYHPIWVMDNKFGGVSMYRKLHRPLVDYELYRETGMVIDSLKPFTAMLDRGGVMVHVSDDTEVICIQR